MYLSSRAEKLGENSTHCKIDRAVAHHWPYGGHAAMPSACAYRWKTSGRKAVQPEIT